MKYLIGLLIWGFVSTAIFAIADPDALGLTSGCVVGATFFVAYTLGASE